MADWEPQRTAEPASRRPAPEIFVNMEFGISLSPRDPPHIASMKYASKNMHQRTYRPDREDRRLESHPSVLIPGGRQQWQRRGQFEQQRQQQQPPSLTVITRPPYERAGSAPPSLPDQSQTISPVSPLSIHRSSTLLEPRERYSTMMQSRERSSTMIDLRDRPLPPLPSRFRLGEDDLPWTVPTWYRPQEPEQEAPRAANPEARRFEDPRRVRELEELHQAMMTVDSLADDTMDTLTSDAPDVPRGPASLGWAVRSEPGPDHQLSDSLEPPPPPYVVSQWEATFNRTGRRPHSAYS